VQESIINPHDQLNKAVDITPFNLGPTVDVGGHNKAAEPLYDANNADDVVFGGWGDDFLHGASGDDAMSGAEARRTSYIQLYAASCTPQQTNNCAIGLVRTDFFHPWNPGDILHFGADTNPWHANGHTATRLGEFLLYDEYDPRREIQFNADGTVWKGTTPTGRDFFLNNDATDGRPGTDCISFDQQGNCTGTGPVFNDGNDVVYGDLGNDWLMGGTGLDTLWGGWGNDLLNADDDLTTGCATYGQGGKCDVTGSTGLGDVTDPHSSYADRAYGGAGLDILIANTAADRLIDWVGEFNSYLVPFSTFGISTVSRQVDPWLPEYLYALSRSQGVDLTRAAETGNDVARNGEPSGELGLVIQHDHRLWQQQTGGPTDPQAGNIPGGKRDTLRSADFNNGLFQGFAPDSGIWQVQNAALSVAAASQGMDADAVFYADVYLPIYYEIVADVTVQKPQQGWNGNAYLLFDYFSPTDFKFAGIDIATNKMVIGHRNAQGWYYDSQASYNGSLKPDTTYSELVAVNGTVVTVSVNGGQAFSYTFAPRILNGDPVALNKGFIGVGSNNSRGLYDNIAVQALPPQMTLDTIEDFNDGLAQQFTGDESGTWTVTSGGRYVSTAAAGTTNLDTLNLGARLQPTSYAEFSATLSTTGIGGITFDEYTTSDFKYVALDVAAQKVEIGHVAPRLDRRRLHREDARGRHRLLAPAHA
jgi:hypothetical protein